MFSGAFFTFRNTILNLRSGLRICGAVEEPGWVGETKGPGRVS